MRTDVLYRAWPRALPEELCGLIQVLGDRLTRISATLDDQDTHAPERGNLNQEVRRTTVGFWDEAHWINGLLMHYAALANREVWSFDISLIAGVQYGIYDFIR